MKKKTYVHNYSSQSMSIQTSTPKWPHPIINKNGFYLFFSLSLTSLLVLSHNMFCVSSPAEGLLDLCSVIFQAHNFCCCCLVCWWHWPSQTQSTNGSSSFVLLHNLFFYLSCFLCFFCCSFVLLLLLVKCRI